MFSCARKKGTAGVENDPQSFLSNISFSKRLLLSEIRPTCYSLHGFIALECCPAETNGQHIADHPVSRKLRLMPQQRTEECINNRIRKIWFQSSRTGIYFRSPLLADADTWEISMQFHSKCNNGVNACLVSCGCYTHIIRSLWLKVCSCKIAVLLKFFITHLL